jgi:dihydroorotase
MCHNPAKIFKVWLYQRRLCRFSYRKFSFALSVNKENIFAKCGWSPFEGFTFKSRTPTPLNGQLVYNNFKEEIRGRMLFDR